METLGKSMEIRDDPWKPLVNRWESIQIRKKTMVNLWESVKTHWNPWQTYGNP